VPPGRRPPAPGSHAHRMSLCCHKGLLVTQVRPVFPGSFNPFPSGRSQPRGILSVGCGPHYSAFDRFRRCNSPACSSLHATSEPFGSVQYPQAAYRLRLVPTASTRVRLTFEWTMPSPVRSAFTSRLPDLNEPHCLYLIAGQSAAGLGMSATPVDFSATELPDRHPHQHRDPDMTMVLFGLLSQSSRLTRLSNLLDSPDGLRPRGLPDHFGPHSGLLTEPESSDVLR
jgi:hypothetical protein